MSLPSFEYRRLIGIAALFCTLAVLLALFAYQVADGVASVERAANEIDDQRAGRATNSALEAMKRQLGATVRDNSYWDDAFDVMNGSEAAAWSVENWGETTLAYPLYDTSLVVNPDGSALIAYHQGEPMKDFRAYFAASLDLLLAAARKADPERNKLPVSFIETEKGIALIGASAIQPYADDASLDRSKLKVLVLAKLLDGPALAEISKNFSITGATLNGTADMLTSPLTDIAGKRIGEFAWQREKVGTHSLGSVWNKFALATGTFVVLLMLIASAAILGIRSIKQSERSARIRATHDPLTGLLNRAGLRETLASEMRTRKAPEAIQFHLIDLDGFKAVNDAWGHGVGDQLIQAVGGRLKASLPAGALIARLGGDEFAVAIPDTSKPLAEFGSTILSLFSAPFKLEERLVEVGASVGSAACDETSMTIDELLRRADLALYRSKNAGKARVAIYNQDLDDDARRAAELEQDIRTAMAEGEFTVAFQPLVDAHTGATRGAEALARWHNPKRGYVSPAIFIAAAERGGLIDRLGFLVLEQAVATAADWPEMGLAINISPLQLVNPLFVEQLAALLQRHGFDPHRLTVEVTEGVLITNQDQAKRAISAMKDMGISIALDDFGCGYASIGALREFGFDRLKVDRSLVVAAEENDEGSAVLQATISLARALQIPVTAEGIETESQAMLVKLFGCDELQGFLYSKPITAKELVDRYLQAARTAA